MKRFSPKRILVLAAGLSLVQLMQGSLAGAHLALTSAALDISVGVMLAIFLGWFASSTKLGMKGLAIMFWTSLFVVQFFNNEIEGYFFTSLFSSFGIFIEGLVFALLLTLVEGMLAAVILGYGLPGISSTASMKEYFSTRSLRSWIERIMVASLSYFPIYFFFGLLISPFVIPYYSSPSLGLRVPPFTVIIPLEVFRGFMYVLVSLPVVAALVPGGRIRFLVLATMLYVLGALIPLLGNPALPLQIIPFHLVEILADSIAYGYVLSRVLGQPSSPQTLPS
jgi:hypothetical protein